MSGSCWACGATSFTGTFAEKLTPASVDLEKYTSLVPRRVSVQTMKISFRASSARDDSVWDAPPASLLTRPRVRPVEPRVANLGKKTSVPVTALLHGEKETHTTPSLPRAR